MAAVFQQTTYCESYYRETVHVQVADFSCCSVVGINGLTNHLHAAAAADVIVSSFPRTAAKLTKFKINTGLIMFFHLSMQSG